jgi:hypothetical protein
MLAAHAFRTPTAIRSFAAKIAEDAFVQIDSNFFTLGVHHNRLRGAAPYAFTAERACIHIYFRLSGHARKVYLFFWVFVGLHSVLQDFFNDTWHVFLL